MNLVNKKKIKILIYLAFKVGNSLFGDFGDHFIGIKQTVFKLKRIPLVKFCFYTVNAVNVMLIDCRFRSNRAMEM